MNEKSGKNQRQYTPINQYKPTGNLVYNPELLENLEKKIHFGDPNQGRS
jgi:hypothetical protein